MRKLNVNELMGSKGVEAKEKNISLDSLHELLGERMPKLEYHPVGRIRLMTALRNRFGDNWRSLPGMNELMKDFDKEAEFNVNLQKMKMIKGK